LIGDPNRLRQIVMNLVSNGITFTEQGQVIVEVESSWENEDEVSLHFSVADTGIGIPSDRLDAIFLAFEQADGSTTRRFGGTGLGLTICSQLIRLMGGKIWVQSHVGTGSRFHFSLRLKKSDELPAPYERAAESDLSDRLVLVVDDNATNRRILEERLISWRMRPSLAEDAGRAMKLLVAAADSGREFDLALIDANMPVVSGLQLAKQIQDHPDLRTCRIMMLSSRDQHGDAIRCSEFGIESYLVKPVSPSTLFDALMSVFGAQPATRPALPVVEDTAGQSLKILVADDQAANRDLAAAILTKRGHEIRFAVNGLEAVRAMEREEFDVVLMDVQMPELDGFQATAAVREREMDTDTHLPIIALTAHAMKGDRAKCLAAGMDGYLAKPLQAKELQTLVESLAKTSAPVFVATPAPRAGSESQPEFDFSSALDRLDNDSELLKRQMRFFLDDAPELLVKVRSAISAQDGKSLRIAAHRLKGLSASYDACEANALAQQLETAGSEGKFDVARPLVDQLGVCIDSLSRAIRAHLLSQ
jgi:CheY-like chemotaxis protein/HPt (histidine-containing phosphotransfer) domain-containing protein